jgi:hypothetical protein
MFDSLRGTVSPSRDAAGAQALLDEAARLEVLGERLVQQRGRLALERRRLPRRSASATVRHGVEEEALVDADRERPRAEPQLRGLGVAGADADPFGYGNRKRKSAVSNEGSRCRVSPIFAAVSGV